MAGKNKVAAPLTVPGKAGSGIHLREAYCPTVRNYLCKRSARRFHLLYVASRIQVNCVLNRRKLYSLLRMEVRIWLSKTIWNPR